MFYYVFVDFTNFVKAYEDLRFFEDVGLIEFILEIIWISIKKFQIL